MNNSDIFFITASIIGSFGLSAFLFLLSDDYSEYKWWFRILAFFFVGVVVSPFGFIVNSILLVVNIGGLVALLAESAEKKPLVVEDSKYEEPTIGGYSRDHTLWNCQIIQYYESSHSFIPFEYIGKTIEGKIDGRSVYFDIPKEISRGRSSDGRFKLASIHQERFLGMDYRHFQIQSHAGQKPFKELDIISFDTYNIQIISKYEYN